MMDDGGVELTYIYNSSGNKSGNKWTRCEWSLQIQTGIDGEGLFRKEMEIWENYTWWDEIGVMFVVVQDGKNLSWDALRWRDLVLM